MLRVLDLFSGIGGFSLGLDATGGFRTVQFVELDDYCRSVLRRHWPEVPIHDDVRTFSAPVGFADVICGGFPCQDLSLAGKGAGLAGERSGLWGEFARLIREVRPRFVIVENVAALLHRGAGVVLGDLAALGYDAEWHCIPASAVGAPHRRDRLWIVAYARDGGLGRRPGSAEELQARQSLSQWGGHAADAARRRYGCYGGWPASSGQPPDPGADLDLADADGEGQPQQARPVEEGGRWAGDGGAPMGSALPDAHGGTLRLEQGRGGGPDGEGSAFPGDDGEPRSLADADGARAECWPGWWLELAARSASPWHVAHPEGIPFWARLRTGEPAGLGIGRSGDGGSEGAEGAFPVAGRPRLALGQRALREWSYAAATGDGWWAAEPHIRRVADGVPARVQRLKALGNAVVPLIPFIIGLFILEAIGYLHEAR